MRRLVPQTGGSSGLLRKTASFFSLILLLCAGSGVAQAQTASTFIDLVDGSSIDIGQPFHWTAEPDALAYYLYVGTAPGLKDVINSRETQATQWPSGELPVGVTLYARIHTKFASGWVNSSASFKVRATAEFTNPATSGASVSPNVQLEWSSVAGAEAYYLYVGSSPGLKDYVNSGETLVTSYAVTGLPIGRPAYARLYTKLGGAWRYVDLTLNVLGMSTFIAPRNGDQQFDPGADIRWNNVEGAQAYYLYVGTAPGLKNLIDSRETQATRWPAMFLPAGQTLYARLHTKVDGVWRYTAVTFQLAPKSVFIEPEADGVELDPRMSLMWTEVPSAQAYYLYVGTSPGLKNVYDSHETSALSFEVDSLPRGPLLHATLHTKAGNAWRSVQRSFSVAPVATILPRNDAPSAIDTRAPVRWTAVDGAQAYYLYVGTTPGAKDLINSRETQALEFPIDSLPAGRTVYVRLYTKHGGVWRFVDATWNTRRLAYLSGSVVATGVWSPATPLTWEPYAGASRYYVYVGSTPGTKDLSSSGEISGTTFTMPAHHAAAIGQDRTVYVRLYSLVDGRWDFVDYTMQFKVASQLTFPKNAAANVGVSALRFTWNAIAGATGYQLQLGTTAGGSDLLDSGTVTALDQRTGALPGGETIYARLGTQIAGEWRYSDSTFATRPVSAFVHPLHGDMNVDFTVPIEWTQVVGAEMYRAEIGSSPGGRDLLDTGLTTDTSVAATPELAAAGGLIYARVWTLHAGVWRFSDAIFSSGATPVPATMTWSTNENDFHARDAFQWSDAGPLAGWYRLQLGTAPGGNELHDSGQVRTVRRLVSGLPENVPLFGTLQTSFVNGSVYSVEFEFVVTDADIGDEDRWTHAMWATAQVRGMAKNGNVPLPNTILLDMARLQLRDSAYCSTYSMALNELTRHLNLGLDVRILNVCLVDNRYDCHTLFEVLDPQSGRWRLLDPTFGMAPRRVSDGEWATSTDMFTTTRDGDFDAIEYVPLTEQGLTFAQAYYLDYPLLFAHVLAPGSGSWVNHVDSVLSYYDNIGLTSIATSGFYAIHCLNGAASVSINVTGADGALVVDADGVAVVPCSVETDGLSHVFRATSIEPVDGGGEYEIVIPRRFVFD